MLIILLLTLLAVLGLCFLKPEKLYSAPSLLVVAYLFFILPQAVALKFLELDRTLVEPWAYDLTLLYGVLCIFASFYGWHGKEYRQLTVQIEKINWLINRKKFFYMMGLLSIGANLASFKLNDLASSNDIESIGGQTTGNATKLIFLSRLIYIPYPYFIIRLIEKSKIKRLLPLVLSSFSEFSRVILNGRRSPLAALSFPALIILFFKKRWVIPRFIIPFIILLPLVIIPGLATLRFDFWRLLFSGQLSTSYLTQLVKSYFLENYPYDLLNSVNAISLSLKQAYIGFGSGFWNDLVFNFVPAQFVGKSFKESLYINISPLSYLRTRELSTYFDVKFGTTITGLGSTFVELSFFGCFFYYFQARLMRTIWNAALRGNEVAQILYSYLTMPILISVTHNFSRFINSLVIGCLTLWLLTRVSRISNNTRSYFNHDVIYKQ